MLTPHQRAIVEILTANPGGLSLADIRERLVARGFTKGNRATVGATLRIMEKRDQVRFSERAEVWYLGDVTLPKNASAEQAKKRENTIALERKRCLDNLDALSEVVADIYTKVESTGLMELSEADASALLRAANTAYLQLHEAINVAFTKKRAERFDKIGIRAA